jgi:hypothetical protein
MEERRRCAPSPLGDAATIAAEATVDEVTRKISHEPHRAQGSVGR